jgi:hypothetical protein
LFIISSKLLCNNAAFQTNDIIPRTFVMLHVLMLT